MARGSGLVFPKPVETGKREQILEAALQLFAEKGFHGTAVPEVAQKAGVGAGTVYRYFPSKEALVNELYRVCKLELSQALLDGFPGRLSSRDQFRELWRRLFIFARRHPRALAFLELHHHLSYLDSRSRAVEEGMLNALLTFTAEAQHRKVLRAMRPERLMAMVYGAFIGLVRASWQGHLDLDEELIDETEAALWEAVRHR